jgi:hypothetical protein
MKARPGSQLFLRPATTAPRLANFLTKHSGRDVIGCRLRSCDDAPPSHSLNNIRSAAGAHPQTMSKLRDVVKLFGVCGQRDEQGALHAFLARGFGS